MRTEHNYICIVETAINYKVCTDRNAITELSMSGPATEKFALRWNDFESNICQAFKRLKDDRDLCDVTCVCEDDQEVEAHKVVLASCSQFFDKIFKKYKNKQVVLYLKGVSCHQLKSLMSFMYLGQVSVSQEELSSFLQAAEELQVRGVMQRQTVGACVLYLNHDTFHSLQ